MYKPLGTAPLDASSYMSPYHLVGPSASAPQNDRYGPLCAKALATLEAMGFSPETMAERGVTWAEDQDPYGHVMHSQYQHYFGLCWFRMMEEYAVYLSPEDYKNTIQGKGIMPVISKYQMNIKRQVKYPDTLIVAFLFDKLDPYGNTGRTVLFSLNQQAIVAETYGTATWINAKTGKPTDIRKAGEGWASMYEAYGKRIESAHQRKKKWEAEHPPKKASKI